METGTIEITIRLDEAITLNWLVSAASRDDDRPTLQAIHVRKDGLTEAVDGFQLHQAPTIEPLEEYVDCLLVPRQHKMTAGNVLFDIIEGNYPDTDMVLPKPELIKFQITVDAKRMTNAVYGFTERSFTPLLGMGNLLTISFIDKYSPVLFEDNYKRRALLMPRIAGVYR